MKFSHSDWGEKITKTQKRINPTKLAVGPGSNEASKDEEVCAAAVRTHLHVRPVQLLDVKVVNVQVQLLLAQLAGGDGLQVGACPQTTTG